MKKLWQETGQTVRAALEGWAPTLRLIALMVAATTLWSVLVAVSS